MKRVLLGFAMVTALAGCGGELSMAFRPDTSNGFVATIHTTASQGSPGNAVGVSVDLENVRRAVVTTSVDCAGMDVMMQVFGPDGARVQHIDPYRPWPLCLGAMTLKAGERYSGNYVFDGTLWDANRNPIDAAPGRYVVVMRVSGQTAFGETKTYELTTSFEWNTP